MFPDNVKVYDLFSANSSSSSISVSNSSSQSSVVIMSSCASTSIRKRVRNTFACFFNSSTSMDILRDLLNASLIIRSAFFSASLIINFDSFVALPLTSSAVSWATKIDLFNVSSMFVKCPSFSRSEEHTSELQSRFDFVCRLLLEKKKNTVINMVTQQPEHIVSVLHQYGQS